MAALFANTASSISSLSVSRASPRALKSLHTAPTNERHVSTYTTTTTNNLAPETTSAAATVDMGSIDDSVSQAIAMLNNILVASTRPTDTNISISNMSFNGPQSNDILQHSNDNSIHTTTEPQSTVLPFSHAIDTIPQHTRDVEQTGVEQPTTKIDIAVEQQLCADIVINTMLCTSNGVQTATEQSSTEQDIEQQQQLSTDTDVNTLPNVVDAARAMDRLAQELHGDTGLKCPGCALPVTGHAAEDDTCVEALNATWHTTCLCCAACGLELPHGYVKHYNTKVIHFGIGG